MRRSASRQSSAAARARISTQKWVGVRTACGRTADPEAQPRRRPWHHFPAMIPAQPAGAGGEAGMWRATGAIAAFAAVLLAPAAARAEQEAYSAALNYATPGVVVPQGASLRFTNLDTLAPHGLVSEEGLFRTDLLQANGSALVTGVDKLPTGTYAFHCTIHSWMTGELQVVPGTGGGVPNPLALAQPPTLGTTAPDPVDLAPMAS